MEKWVEVFCGKIPQAIYQTNLTNGEKQGLIIELSDKHIVVRIKFGVVQAVRMLDEGIGQNKLYSSKEIDKYKAENFHNIIYEVQGGSFGRQISEISDGYGEFLHLRHYVVVTPNYNIDVITEWEPTVEVSE